MIGNGAETLSLNSSRRNSKFSQPSKLSKSTRSKVLSNFVQNFTNRAIKRVPRSSFWCSETRSLKIRRNKIWNFEIERNGRVSKLQVYEMPRTPSSFLDPQIPPICVHLIFLNAWMNLWREYHAGEKKKKKRHESCPEKFIRTSELFLLESAKYI